MNPKFKISQNVLAYIVKMFTNVCSVPQLINPKTCRGSQAASTEFTIIGMNERFARYSHFSNFTCVSLILFWRQPLSFRRVRSGMTNLTAAAGDWSSSERERGSESPSSCQCLSLSLSTVKAPAAARSSQVSEAATAVWKPGRIPAASRCSGPSSASRGSSCSLTWNRKVSCCFFPFLTLPDSGGWPPALLPS